MAPGSDSASGIGSFMVSDRNLDDSVTTVMATVTPTNCKLVEKSQGFSGVLFLFFIPMYCARLLHPRLKSRKAK